MSRDLAGSVRAFGCALALAFVAAPAQAGLVHEWTFNTDTSDAVGGSAYAGTRHGDAYVANGSDGMFGHGYLTGLKYDNQSHVSVNTYFAPPGTTNGGGSGTRSYTVSAWIKGYESTRGDRHVIT
jgi:hypothetical protein